MPTFARRISRLMKERGITQAELARLVGTKQQTISYLIRAESNTQSSRYTTRIANILKVNPLWLQTGEGNPHDPQFALSETDLLKDACQIPIISCKEILNFLSDMSFETKGYLMSGRYSPAKKFAFVVEDNSNSPVFIPGDVVVIQTDLKPVPGEYVVAKADDGEAVLRKVKVRSKSFELVPHNPDWSSVTTSDPDDILGVMVEHRRYWKR